MALMTKKIMETGTGNGAQGPWDLPTASWKTSETYVKHHTCYKGDWGHQLRGGEREVRIRIMFHNMGSMGNTSDQPTQHKLDTFKSS